MERPKGETALPTVKGRPGVTKMQGGDGQTELVGNGAAVLQPAVLVTGVTVAAGGRVYTVAPLEQEEGVR